MTAISPVRRAGILMAAVSLILGGTNEVGQRLVQRGLLDYHPLFGYVSDFCAVPFATGLVVALSGRVRGYLPFGFAIVYSLLELAGVRDPVDIAMYWFSALIVWGLFTLEQRRNSVANHEVETPSGPVSP